MANEMNQKPVSNEERFVEACWAYKRRQRTKEPTAHEFGLNYELSEVLARQVQIEFQNQVTRYLPKPAKKAVAA